MTSSRSGRQLRLPLEAQPAPPASAPRSDIALTVWQPWASAIFADGPGRKDVENRPWPTSYRGPLIIHAGRRWDPDGQPLTGLEASDCPRGVLLGVVDLVDVVRDSDSPWAVAGQWHWILANPRLFPEPVPHRGHQRLWSVRLP